MRLSASARPRRRVLFARTVLPPLTLGAVLLAGCAGDEPGGDTTTTAEPTVSPDETMEPDGTTSPTGDAAAGAGADCLLGEWTADIDATEEVRVSAPGLEDLDPRATVTGEATVTFDESTMTTEYDNQVTELTLTLEGSEVVVTTTFNGTVTSSYTATDTELTVTDVDVDDLDVETTTTMGGQETELAPDLQGAEMFGTDLSGVSDYTCDEGRLEITPQVEGAGSFSQVLTRD